MLQDVPASLVSASSMDLHLELQSLESPWSDVGHTVHIVALSFVVFVCVTEIS